jgi:hypothetical protein
MIDRIILKQENTTPWYPYPIPHFESHLGILIKENGFCLLSQVHPLKKNIAYSLQYVEFLNQVLKDIKLSSVLTTQNIKSFVVHGAAIIEAIFYYLVISKGFGKKTDWKKVNSHTSSEYLLGNKKYRDETEIHEKLDIPIITQMTFDQLAKIVESKKLLGENFLAYSKIPPIRKLRNKIHIHDSEHSQDTDWHNFNDSEFKLVKDVLYAVLTSDIFQGSSHFQIFSFLQAEN